MLMLMFLLFLILYCSRAIVSFYGCGPCSVYCSALLLLLVEICDFQESAPTRNRTSNHMLYYIPA